MLTVVMAIAVPLKRAPLQIYETGLVFLPLLKATQEWNVLESHVGSSELFPEFWGHPRNNILGQSRKIRHNHRGPNQTEHGGWGTTPMLQQPKTCHCFRVWWTNEAQTACSSLPLEFTGMLHTRSLTSKTITDMVLCQYKIFRILYISIYATGEGTI